MKIQNQKVFYRLNGKIKVDTSLYLLDPKHQSWGLSLENMILLDFDDLHEASIALEYIKDQNYQCLVAITDQGCHLYFKQPKDLKIVNTNYLLASGLRADVKYGKVNYGVVWFRSKWRLDPDYDFEPQELDELPEFFYPTSRVKETLTFDKGMRNDSFMRLCGYIRSSNVYSGTMKFIKRIADDINNYTLEEPFTKKELNSKLKSMQKKIFEVKKDNSLKSNEWVQEDVEYFTKPLRYHKELYLYLNDKYTNDTDTHNRFLLTEYNIKKEFQRKEILEQIRLLAKEVRVDKFLLQTKSEYLKFKDNKFIKVEGGFTLHRTVVDYKKNAYNKYLDKFLNDITLNKKDRRRELLETLSHSLLPMSTRTLYIFKGSGRNGKSLLFKLLTDLWEKVDDIPVSVGFESLEMLQTNDFAPATLKDKLFNISDELNNNYFEGSGILKAILSGETIHTSAKGKDRRPQSFELNLYLLTNSNLLNRDKSRALSDRFKFIAMDHSFPKIDAIKTKHIEEQLLTTSSKEYLLKLLIEHKESNKNTMTKRSKELFEEFLIQQDATQLFLSEERVIEGKTLQEVYEEYIDWMHEIHGISKNKTLQSEGIRIISKHVLSKKIKDLRLLSLVNTTREGRQVRIFKTIV